MFERYTESAKRAIFYARAVAIIGGASQVGSLELLSGLMWPDRSKAEHLFRLREKFPQHCKYLKLSIFRTTLGAKDLKLTDEVKRILARTVMEADRIGNKWIDTDHLLLGILCEPDCLAAQELVKAGIPLEKARHIVIENRLQRLKRLSRLKLGSLALPGWILSWLRSKRRGRKSESSEKTPGAAGADNSKLS